MATVIDVSSNLGVYMLKGWVLTDIICSKCGRVPLMRSPSSASAVTQFCVNCDPAPDSNAGASASSQLRPTPVPQASFAASSVSSTHMSRSSTPPTDVSSAPDSPLLAPLMDPAELLRRRQQSDTASAEIGRRMLRGWAMLGDECPGSNCYGIPLVRPPKVQATIDPRKECVICGTVYVDEKDVLGQNRLVPMLPASSSAATYRSPPSAAAGLSSPPQTYIDKGKGKATPNMGTRLPDDTLHHPSDARREPHMRPQPKILEPRSSTSSALELSARSLEQSLLALSARLDTLSAGPILDTASIGQTADTIAKVSQALAQVKQLLWSEQQARIALEPCAHTNTPLIICPSALASCGQRRME